MTEAILFDVGGVYLQGSFVDFVNKSYQILGFNKTFYTDKEVVFDKGLNRGTIETEECFRKYFGVSISDDKMERIKSLWTTTWKPTTEMTNIVNRLKPNYKLAVLSNSDKMNSEKYSERGWYDPFEVLILSHELGVIKPERKIYEIAVKRVETDPEKCLFIDDQEVCLIPAREMRMDTILFNSSSNLKTQLKERRIKV